MMMLGKKGLSSERAKDATSVIAPMASTINSGIHKRAWMKTLVSVIGKNRRAAKPVSRPPMKTITALMSKAISVSKRKRGEPVKMASRKPTHGVMSGVTRMPSKSTACESSKNPSPTIAPHTREKTNNSKDGYARRDNEEMSAACPSASAGILSRRITRLRRPRADAAFISRSRGGVGSVGMMGSSEKDILSVISNQLSVVGR